MGADDHRGKVGRIYKEDTTHCYIQNMKALGLVVSEKKFFCVCVFPMTPPGRGLYGPQCHGWQDL